MICDHIVPKIIAAFLQHIFMNLLTFDYKSEIYLAICF